MQKIDLDGLSVNILIKVEDMHLGYKFIFTEGRVESDIDNASVLFPIVDDLAYINTMPRYQIFFVDMKIGGGKTNFLAASLFAPLHLAANLVTPSQQRLGFVEEPLWHN